MYHLIANARLYLGYAFYFDLHVYMHYIIKQWSWNEVKNENFGLEMRSKINKLKVQTIGIYTIQ